MTEWNVLAVALCYPQNRCKMRQSLINNISQTMLPRQLGVRVKGGLEAAVHTTRRYFELNEDDHSKVAVKFKLIFPLSIVRTMSL